MAKQDDDTYWHKLCQIIVKRYEKETGRTWVSGSPEVREWLEKMFPKREAADAKEKP